MAKHTFTVDFTAAEEAALADIMATNPELLTIDTWLQHVVDEHIIQQGREYINVVGRKKLMSLDPATALAKLNA